MIAQGLKKVCGLPVLVVRMMTNWKKEGIPCTVYESEPSASHYRPREWGMSIQVCFCHWIKHLLSRRFILLIHQLNAMTPDGVNLMWLDDGVRKTEPCNTYMPVSALSLETLCIAIMNSSWCCMCLHHDAKQLSSYLSPSFMPPWHCSLEGFKAYAPCPKSQTDTCLHCLLLSGH